MKKFILFVLVCLLLPAGAWAGGSVPKVSSYLLNGRTENIVFAPGDKITIELTTDQPVKFNTIAICSIGDSVCSRTTSVKYFTQATTFSSSITKEWDGKTGGQNPVAVSAGEYKIKATIKNESGDEGFQELSPYLITIDPNAPVINNDGGGDDGEEGGNESVVSNVDGNSDSAHSAQVDLSTVKNSPPKIGAGRKRTTAIGTPINFEALVAGKDLEGRYSWSWGDGTSSSGKNVSHTYEFSGTYNVVLNATFPEGQAVARTEVVAIDPLVKISEINQRAGYVELSNGGAGEVNINGWVLQKGSVGYKFPLDTIIGGKKSVKIPLSLLKFGTTSEPVYLMYANGKVVNAEAAKAGLGSISTTTVAQLQKALEKLAAVKAEAKQAPTVASGVPVAELAVAGASRGGGADEVAVSSTPSGKTFQPAPVSPAPASANVAEVIVLDKKPGLFSRAVLFVQKLWTR